MPKIIEALRESLLREARIMLLEEGDVTIRAVANRCHVAVGTVYNYFHSKDELMAYVMLADWQQALYDMRSGAEQSADAISALQCVYDALSHFEGLYRDAWAHYAKGNDAHSSISQRHDMLVEQLIGVVAPALEAHGALWDPYLPTFLCETLLTAVSHGPEHFALLTPILTRLIAAPEK